jgi:hypothetical protein
VHVLIAAGALPLLVSCSSSSSVEYATDAFPSQSLVDLLKESKSPPPPAPSATPPVPSTTSAALPAPIPTTAAANPPPAATTSAANDDPVAAAFPSVSLIDLLKGERKPGSQ